VEPGRQTVFCEFQAKNVASGSNDLQQLFRKWIIKLGEPGVADGQVVTYLTRWHHGTVSHQTNITKQPFNLNAQRRKD